MGICDAFDAMTSHRPYRKGMPVTKAFSIIEENLGSQFNRVLGGQFLDFGHQGLFHHIVGHSDAGIPLLECPLCGPTLAIRREQASGDHVYCPNCTSEFRLTRVNDRFDVVPTMQKGSARNLAPEPDTELIRRLIEESVQRVAFPELLADPQG